ncbi:hypothetical protein [Vagococcus sp. WN89Y]|uniref:hypothetical protein n=1 Tax=Vagococcus sp. WN89Y TaxID=3457258 RepID=UPI003FCC585D
MAVNNSDFFNFAKDCYKRNDEIGFRNVISRAYYAAYHNSLTNVDMPPREFNHHSGLIKHIGSLSRENQSFQEISRLLRVMRNARNDADYKLEVTATKNMASQNLVHYQLIDNLWSLVRSGVRSTK